VVILPDVDVLVYAHRKDATRHAQYERWLLEIVNGNEAFGLADQVLSGFVRVVTHPRVFKDPSALETALDFCERLCSAPNRVEIIPGARH
jgi:uncharacterized protein